MKPPVIQQLKDTIAQRDNNKLSRDELEGLKLK